MVGAQGQMQADIVIAYMVIAGIIGFLIDIVMVAFEKLLLRWKQA